MNQEVMEDVPGTVRFNADGGLEQAREIKHLDDDGAVIAIELRWVLVPTVA